MVLYSGVWGRLAGVAILLLFWADMVAAAWQPLFDFGFQRHLSPVLCQYQAPAASSAVQALCYPSVRPGVTLVLYGRGHGVEFDYLLAPGVDGQSLPWQVRHALRHTAGRWRIADSAYQISSPEGFIWTGDAWQRHAVQKFSEGVGLRSGGESRWRVWDPVLTHASRIGGEGADVLTDVVVAADGTLYVAGNTASLTVPVPDGMEPTLGAGGSRDAIIMHLSAGKEGLVLQQITRLGGQGRESVASLALDEVGQTLYIAGDTDSADFLSAGAGGDDLWLGRLGLGDLSTFSGVRFGGKQRDMPRDLVLDASGVLLLAGETESALLQGQSTQARQQSPDIFIQRWLVAPLQLEQTRILGSSGSDRAAALVVDGQGRAFLAGSTDSSVLQPLPLVQAQAAHGGVDAFIAGLAVADLSMQSLTFVGGRGEDTAAAMVLTAAGDLALLGFTRSSDLAVTKNAYQIRHAEEEALLLNTVVPGNVGDGFLSLLRPADLSLVYGSYLGGRDLDIPLALADAADQGLWLSGLTQSTNLVDRGILGERRGGGDVFILRINPQGNGAADVKFSAFLTGRGVDAPTAMAAGLAVNEVFVVGGTTSEDFAEVNPLAQQPAGRLAQQGDGFIVKYGPGADLNVFMQLIDGTVEPIKPGSDFTYVLSIENKGPDAASQVQVFEQLPNVGRFITASSRVAVCDAQPDFSGLLVCRIAAIAARETVRIDLQMKAPLQEGVIVNSAEALGDEVDKVVGNNSFTLSTLVSSKAPSGVNTGTGALFDNRPLSGSGSLGWLSCLLFFFTVMRWMFYNRRGRCLPAAVIAHR